jgi:RNA recognition motif-containing protein
MVRVYVGNLPPETREEDLDDLFRKVRVTRARRRGARRTLYARARQGERRVGVARATAARAAPRLSSPSPRQRTVSHLHLSSPLSQKTTPPQPQPTQYGRIRNINLKRPARPPYYAFVEFDDPRDAEDAARGRDGCSLLGARLRVEIARGREDRGGERGERGGGARGGPRFRVLLRGVPPGTSWQNLKDWVRDRGGARPAYADVRPDDGAGGEGGGAGAMGVVEFESKDDAKDAAARMDGQDFDGGRVRADYDGESTRAAPPQRYGGGDRGYGGGGGDRYGGGGDRYGGGGDRYGGGGRRYDDRGGGGRDYRGGGGGGGRYRDEPRRGRSRSRSRSPRRGRSPPRGGGGGGGGGSPARSRSPARDGAPAAEAQQQPQHDAPQEQQQHGGGGDEGGAAPAPAHDDGGAGAGGGDGNGDGNGRDRSMSR